MRRSRRPSRTERGNISANDLEFQDDARPVRLESARITTCGGLVREPRHWRQCYQREPNQDAVGERPRGKRPCGSKIELANLRREPRPIKPNPRLVDIREYGLVGSELYHPDRRRIGIVDMNKDLAAVSNQGADAAMQGGKHHERGRTELAQAGIEKISARRLILPLRHQKACWIPAVF